MKATSPITNSYFSRLRKSAIKHPLVVVVLVIYALLIIAGINGSSIGLYSTKPHALLTSDRIGVPRPIRSDEWIVNTQMTIAQEEAGYPRINPNIGQGEDVSVILDVPYKEWSTAFKPQNLAFLILPFTNAFALKWWFSIVLMLISTYFIAIFFLKHKRDARLLSSLLAVSTTFTSMLIWWHQSTTTISLSIAYLMVIANIFVRVLDKPRSKALLTKRNLTLVLATSYPLTCWIMLMYPPFQIASLWGFVIVLSGYSINVARDYDGDIKHKLKELTSKLIPFIVAGILSAVTFIIFIKTRSNVIHIIQSTAYPGKRNIAAGGMTFKELMIGSYDYSLQFGTRSVGLASIASNQSEISSFGPWWMFIFILMPLLLVDNFKKKLKRINWQALAILTGSILVLIRMFIGWGSIFYKPALLYLIPQNRLKIIFVVLAFFGLLTWIANAEDVISTKESLRHKAYVLLSAAMFIITFGIGLYVSKDLPGYLVKTRLESLLVATAVASALYLALTKRFKAMMTIITIFTLLSSIFINPLQKGLGIMDPGSAMFKDSRRQIQSIISKDDLVVENSSIQQESLMEVNGRHSLTAVYSYPELNLWKSIDQQDEAIYNRYAHVYVKLNDKDDQPNLELTSPDSFAIDGNICKIKDIDFGGKKVTKVISGGTLTSPCLTKVGTVHVMNIDLIVYKVV